MEQLERRLANALGQSFLCSVGTRPRSVQLPGYCNPATGYFGAGGELRLKMSSVEPNYNGSQKKMKLLVVRKLYRQSLFHSHKWTFQENPSLTSSWVKQKVLREAQRFCPKTAWKTYVENGRLSQGLMTDSYAWCLPEWNCGTYADFSVEYTKNWMANGSLRFI